MCLDAFTWLLWKARKPAKPIPPWNCPETALKLPGNCSEIARKLLWNCSETALKLLCSNNCIYALVALKLARNWLKLVLKLPWNCPEIALKLLGNCSEIALKLLCSNNCTGTALKWMLIVSEWFCRSIKLRSNLRNRTKSAMKPQWNRAEITLNLRLTCPEIALKLPRNCWNLLWYCPGTALKLPWNWLKLARKLPWNCPEIALKLLWYRIETALKLLWNWPNQSISFTLTKNEKRRKETTPAPWIPSVTSKTVDYANQAFPITSPRIKQPKIENRWRNSRSCMPQPSVTLATSTPSIRRCRPCGKPHHPSASNRGQIRSGRPKKLHRANSSLNRSNRRHLPSTNQFNLNHNYTIRPTRPLSTNHDPITIQSPSNHHPMGFVDKRWNSPDEGRSE